MLGKNKRISGTALKIYLTLLSSREPMSLRELQRKVGLKAVSTVKYHLDRLKEAGLVRQRMDGTYEALKSENPMLSLYIFFRNSPIPKLLPLAIGFAVFVGVYSLFRGFVEWPLVAASFLFAGYVLYESIKLIKLMKNVMS